LLATVRRVPDEPLASRIHDEVENLPRNDADRGRAVIGKLRDVDGAVAPRTKAPDLILTNLAFEILLDIERVFNPCDVS
jgi:hypothetical protein